MVGGRIDRSGEPPSESSLFTVLSEGVYSWLSVVADEDWTSRELACEGGCTV